MVCQDWAQLASGTTTATVGDVSMVDCPKDGCLGFAFTLPEAFVGNKKYNDVGAKHTHCFAQSAWAPSALVPRRDGSMLADPLCGAPRPVVPGDFCSDPGTPGTPTATRTNTPAGMGATPTSTATGGATPTRTPTRTTAATATATRSGGATATATTTGLTTPTPTPSITPTPVGATPTVTPTSGGGLSWSLNGSSVANITIPQGGMSYPPGMLDLIDGQNRFCTTAGIFPVLTIDTTNNPPIGVFPMNTTGRVGIGNIPGVPQPGTYDVLIQTRVPCSASQPMTLRFSGAITYGG